MKAWVEWSADDEYRRTLRPVQTADDATRALIGRNFIGFHCDIKLNESGYKSTLENVAVEGVARRRGGGYVNGLVITQPPATHDLASMEWVPLTIVRSIETIRRF